jgi:fumarylpyruvate hydrolase
MAYAVSAASIPALPIRGSDELFPVHRIYCVGRNYAAHAIEMGHDPDREEPFFFQKNPDNLVLNGSQFPYPGKTKDVHPEIQLVVALALGGRDITADDALGLIYGYAVGLDMTRRDLQSTAKKQRRPWEIAKAFDFSAPCGEVVPVQSTGHPNEGRIALYVNDQLRQEGNLNQLIWKVPEIIAHLSGFFTLTPGDLIYTGTPSGVGAVNRGDILRGSIESIDELTITVV